MSTEKPVAEEPRRPIGTVKTVAVGAAKKAAKKAMEAPKPVAEPPPPPPPVEETKGRRCDSALTKQDLAEMLEFKFKLDPDTAGWIVQSILDKMLDSLKKGWHIEFRDFGVFEVIERKSRLGRNPRKPAETVIIPPRRTVRFKPGKMMKTLVSKQRPDSKP